MPYRKKKTPAKASSKNPKTKVARCPIEPLANIHVLQDKKIGKRHQHIDEVFEFYNSKASPVQCMKGLQHYKRHESNLVKGFYSNPIKKLISLILGECFQI